MDFKKLRAIIKQKEREEAAAEAAVRRTERARKAKVDPKHITQSFAIRGGLVLNDREFDRMAAKLNASEDIFFDTETDSTKDENPGDGLKHDRYAVSWQFGTSKDWVWYVPLRHYGGPNYSKPERCAELFQDFLRDRKKRIVAHNIAYDLNTAAREGVDVVDVRATLDDTQIIDWLLDPGIGHKIEEVIMRRYGWRMGTFKQFLAPYGSFSFVPVNRAVPYGVDDVRWLPRLVRDSLAELKQDPLTYRAYRELEMPVMHPTAYMNRTGMKIQTGYLGRLDADFAQRVDAEEETIASLVGVPRGELKLGSTQWLAKTFIDELKWWAPSSSAISEKTGKHSTGKHFLERWAAQMPKGTTPQGADMAGRILDHRKLGKLRSTYTVALAAKLSEDGRIHSSFNQTGTRTGRYSSSGPNLQNIPVRTDDGAKIRSAFIGEAGWTVLDADYSQIELRILAHFCGDPRMMEVYMSGGDIHQMTADAVGCTRNDAKSINFGLMYGMGVESLATTIRQPVHQARKFLARYFQEFGAVKAWKEGVVERARRDGYTTTITGRRRQLKDIRSRDGQLRSRDERVAVNTKIQGSAADIIKIGMRNVWRRMLREKLLDRLRLLMQIHDELVFEVRNDFVDTGIRVVKEEMEAAVVLRVPLIAEPGVGPDWLEAH